MLRFGSRYDALTVPGLKAMCLYSRKSAKPAGPRRRPWPLCLKPPSSNSSCMVAQSFCLLIHVWRVPYSQEKQGHFYSALEVQAENRMFHPTFTSPSRPSTTTHTTHCARFVPSMRDLIYTIAVEEAQRGGMAWRRSPAFHPSVHIPTLRCQIGPPFSEFTSGLKGPNLSGPLTSFSPPVY